MLATAVGSEGPGPLVSSIAGKSATGYPIPVTLVPGDLSDEEILSVA